MRLRLAACVLALAVLVPTAGGAASPFTTRLTTAGHTAKVNAKWWWTLRVADAAGKPVRATLTLQIVDPFGGTHPVELGDTTRRIVNVPFVGRLRDFVRFPPESRGFPLTLRYTVKARGGRRVLTYKVTSH
jgi:hypothetical protein